MSEKFLAIDPGSRFTGFAVASHYPFKCFEVGVIQPKKIELEDRFKIIFEALMKLTAEYRIKTFVVEKVFHHKNAVSALKLAMARGIVFTVAGIHHAKDYEIRPKKKKKVVSGKGHASKDEVANSIKLLTGISNLPTNDATDALAIAYAFSSKKNLWNSKEGFSI